ncbi:MAG: excisionase family DNA-binding protein [Anaerolineales bacterium]|nr:excisionase family DNA-binding protein [Anaerolineales bacterium]
MSEPVAEGWLTTDEAGALTGYGAPYVRQLIGHGRVQARRVGRIWLVDRASLLAHRAEMEALGRRKHNPWRQELVEAGRGRRAQAGSE